ncbi:host specificity factor TipJ family phage tail protein [Mesorhizobium sp. CN5-321]|uniref:host specificity factor TipJ family phage tail protein n=1 Tax=Mesorhizobium hunchu TaxID=3157708 RepID=UPI0032B7E007
MNAIVRAPLSGEILSPADIITVTAAVHPLKPNAELLILPAGLSVAEIIREVGKRCCVSRLASGANVSISGHVIHEEFWRGVRVKPGAHVVVRARAGKSLGNIFKTILMIGLAVLAPWAGGLIATAGWGLGLAAGTFGAQLAAGIIGGAILVGGSLLLNALFPPTQTKSITESQSYSISAGKNGASKWGAIPVVLGKIRAMPKYAALPYTEFDGDDQYLRLLFVWGYGPMKIEDIKIGDTSIDEFDDVEIETFEGYADDGQQTIYPSEVVQDDISVDPPYNDPVVRTSAEDADEIVLDFVAPTGIGKFDKKGNIDSRTVQFKIEMSPAGAGTWTNKGTVSFSAKTSKALRRSFRYPVTKGEYDIRVTRLTANSDSTKVLDDVTWTAIKSFRTDNPPISFGKPLAITAMRIRATKQLNGVVDTLNGLVTSVGKSWDGTSWVDAQETRNPADLMRLVLQGPANARAVPDSRLDLSTFAAFAERCTSKGFTFDMYRDFTASVRDTLADIAAAGRATAVFKDGKWSVAWEQDDAPVMQHFTPRNSRDFRWTQTYRTLPHGLRCKFVNADKDYIEDEILVFDEGYTKDNATLYEQAEFPGVTSAEQVYKQALYRIADARERPAVYTVTVDFEHLVSQRADRVAVQHDVIRQGLCSGRVKAVSGQQITLDEPAVMEEGKFYGIRFRLADGTSVVRNVTTAAGEQSVITIVGTAPEVGDLYSFGERDHETGIYRILRIRPGDDLSAELDLVDDGPNVQAGDSETDIPGGTVTPIPPLSSLTPFGLHAEGFVQSGQTGSTYVVRVYWQAVLGPQYTSFEVVGTSDGGIIKETVGADDRVAEFDNVQSGSWSFTVRGLIEGGKYTLPSAPLAVNIDVPYDDIGVATEDLAADLADLHEWTGNAVRDVLDELRAVSAWAANQELSNFSDKQQLRTELRSEGDGITAAYTDAITVATGPGSALSQRITTLEAEIPDLASAEALSALDARVTTAEGDIVSNADAITSLTTTVAGKADASTVSALSSTVSTQGGTITSQGDAITALQNSVNDPVTGLEATADAVSSLGTTVTSLGDDITANASAITALQASYGDVSAGATFRMGTGYTPSTGWDSIIGLETRVNSGGSFRSAGLFLVSTADEARIILDADQVAVVADDVVAALFASGTTFIDNGRIKNLTAANIIADKLDAAEVLQNGTLVTDLIGKDTIIANDSMSIYTDVGIGAVGVMNTIASLDCPNPNPSFVLIDYSLTGAGGGGTAVYVTAQLVRDVNGVETVLKEIRGTTISGFMIDEGAAIDTVYKIKAGNRSTGSTMANSGGTVKIIWWKR